MMTLIRKSWFNLFGRRDATIEKTVKEQKAETSQRAQTVEFDMAPNDPLLAYLLNVSSVVEVDHLHLESPTLDKLKQAGIKVVVPLISQGELIGLLNLGPRRSEQEYSADDRRLLNTLASQAAPALRVAQLARQQQAEARERERIAQELRVARVIQQTLLPKEIPAIPGWQIAAHWQPARAVSGDFYDFITFPDGQFGIVVGDVTDKGVPAALVMATTRSVLRQAAERLVMPGAVLAEANNTLCPDIPMNMFVTCLYMLLDPRTGHLRYANAGHNLPYQQTENGVLELRARGMPLGLMPEMDYEEKEADLAPGDQIILYSDGLTEAHNVNGEMFGYPRLREMLAHPICSNELIHCLLEELSTFTGPDWEQEDDVTFVSLSRSPQTVQDPEPAAVHMHQADDDSPLDPDSDEGWQRIAAFDIASQPGNERQAMEAVAKAIAEMEISPARLERLKTAVAEAAMNAMEHGNHYAADKPVEIEVLLRGTEPAAHIEPAVRIEPAVQKEPAAQIEPASQVKSAQTAGLLAVRIRDHGGSQIIPESEAPDLDAKLSGLQSPRGWGLFLIKNMVDEMHVSSDETHHTIELILHLESEEK